MKIKTLQSLQNILLYLIIFLLPTQFGKHFWPSFSFVSGLRIDYLSPTLYLTDILVAVLFGLWIFSTVKPFIKKVLSSKYSVLRENGIIIFSLMLLFIDLLIGALFSGNLNRSLFGILKIFEMIFFGLIVWKSSVSIKTLTSVFLAGVFCEALLSLAQFLNRGSLGGLFYFFGERTFSASTPGIANASVSGELFLRPYGTLPHPNVLAGFLLVGIIFLCSRFSFSKKNRALYFLLFTSYSTALLVTLSRVAIFLWVGTICFFLLRRTRKLLFLFIAIATLFIFTTPLLSRFLQTSLLEEAVVNRVILTEASLEMISVSPIFGIGILQFIPTLPAFLPSVSFLLLQPVHNIFLLVFAETGAIGFAILVWFLVHTFLYVRKTKEAWRLVLFFSILVLGSFDHYLLTLQQGQLLLAFCFGILWSPPILQELRPVLSK